jgi:hypothetical protein
MQQMRIEAAQKLTHSRFRRVYSSLVSLVTDNGTMYYCAQVVCSFRRIRLRIIAVVMASALLPGLFAQNSKTEDWRKQLQSGATLGTVRRSFLNQSVILGGTVVTLRGSVLLEWHVVQKNGDRRYEPSAIDIDNLPATYKGKKGTVIAVQLNALKARERGPNALGEIAAEDDIVDPYFDVVVRVEDGTLAMTTAYPLTLSTGDEIELASAAGLLTEQISKQLPLLIGKTVYAVGYSKLYSPDTTLDELTLLQNRLGRSSKQMSFIDVPLLQPLTVLAAKYIESAGVVFKPRLPNGREAIAFTDPIYYHDKDKPLLDGILGTLLSRIPAKLTQMELDTIRRGALIRGMKKSAVEYSMGFPDKENNWDTGGKQLIYSDSIFVYLDHDDKVTNWQLIDKK